jgi:2-polyprenyl-3-methyl-5-hydroxy-6-metoxy-1,4-benzoquinol methylase
MSDESNEAIIRRIAARYRLHPRRAYVRGKLRWDPVFATIAPLVVDSPRALLDIGCGFGLLGQYLRECGFRAPYLGLDLDEAKIDEARSAAGRGGLDIDFTTGSAAALPDFGGDIAMLDVLHYMPADSQQRLLAETAARVPPGGLLLIRNVLNERGWRFRATVAEEYLARVIGWMRVPTRHFPRREEIEAPLRDFGFATRVLPLWGSTPFNSYLFIARRETTGA